MVKNAPNDHGIALVLVLWVLTLLSVLVGEFSQTMRTEINITRNFKEETQCYYFARAGIDITLNSLLFNEPFPVGDKTDHPEEEGFEWHIGLKVPAVSFGEGTIEIEIGNESGKFNLNTADTGLLKVMLNPFDLDEEDRNIIVDSILDWRDKDDLHRLNGAEKDYYQSLPNPYNAKNGDFDSIDELLMVRGITPEIFYGGLREMVTLYPKNGQISKEVALDQNKLNDRVKRTSSSLTRININAAPPRVLLALPLMTDELVLSILDYRAEQPFKSVDQLVQIVGPDVYRAISQYISTELVPQYAILAAGAIPGSRTRRAVRTIIEIDPIKHNYNMLEWLDNAEVRPKTKGAAL